MSSSNQDRRKHQRFKIKAPIEFHPEGSRTLRSATADLSLGGCYLEMLFTFPIGTILEVTLQVGRTVQAKAIVVSRELQVGNGIQFIDMAAMDRDAIRNYMENAIKENLSANERPENME
jgi:c-di-GMP-binding flagellar brake protein YcgR